MSAPRKVLVTTRLFDDAAAEYLAEHGCVVVPSGLPGDALDADIPDATLSALLEGVEGWIVGMRAVTREILAAHPDLKVIARRGVGYERVDVASAKALGRVVTIAAGANDDAVADHTLAMILALLRRLKESDRAIAAGNWRVLSGYDLTGKTVGLVGLGRIGKAVARRLHGFGTKVLVATRTPDPDFPFVDYVPLDDLIAQSDIISIHAPLTSETRHMIGADALAAMKPHALVINTSRGGLVDDRALLAALEAGRIGGAGLDVFEAEADAAMLPVAAALAARPDVVATAHASGSSAEALARGNLISAQCVVAALDGTDFPPGCLIADGR
ncbi:D-3-phosphoglycerate dehydrogenase [Xanthobacter flavus]|uniref:D-3-phosphoglycerate dehydrogenase n=1 Tax=Xanthobacter flavus TaxID=281 RepID=A0A9W6CPK0_XANFL|nr:phosphoglycerate dehydrogenase [Xanthobacter flavus]MDR6334936.1 D-3-phosphoglycerate dehydrogenase [Xanthobacter flavus]GLI23841.1 D-isomer specific 2-hydroxyacid dehydrogenase [Xanthobacter flavus]